MVAKVSLSAESYTNVKKSGDIFLKGWTFRTGSNKAHRVRIWEAYTGRHVQEKTEYASLSWVGLHIALQTPFWQGLGKGKTKHRPFHIHWFVTSDTCADQESLRCCTAGEVCLGGTLLGKGTGGTSGRWLHTDDPFLSPPWHHCLVRPAFYFYNYSAYVDMARVPRETTKAAGSFRTQGGDSHGWARRHFSRRGGSSVSTGMAASSPERF